MELRHLRYFVSVADERGFSPAARKLHVSQSAISEQIHNLEEELGVPLLDRGQRTIRLTPHGEIFLREARSVLTAADHAVEMAQRSVRGETGTLNIGFFVWGVGAFFPKLIREYRRRFPGVRLCLFEMTAVMQNEAFQSGRIDIGFTRPLEPPFSESLQSELLYRDPIVAVLPRNHRLAKGPIPVESLAGEKFVLCDRSSSPTLFDSIIALCRNAGFSPRIANTANVWSGVLTLVEAGEGIALVPSGLRHMMPTPLVFSTLKPNTATVGLVLAWRPDSENRIQKAFLDLVREYKTEIRNSIRL